MSVPITGLLVLVDTLGTDPHTTPVADLTARCAMNNQLAIIRVMTLTVAGIITEMTPITLRPNTVSRQQGADKVCAHIPQNLTILLKYSQTDV